VFASIKAPRGIAVDPQTGLVYAASEGDGTVYVYTPNGKKSHSIPFPNPIGVYINGGVLYISGKATVGGSVLSFSLPSLSAGQTYQVNDPHPTGIVVYGGSLYVLGQGNHRLYQYNQQSGKFIGTVISGFTDDPEQITISTAC